MSRTQVDYASFSAYDVMRLNQTSFDSTLDYVASKLLPKSGLSGKRVFVGEFGIPAAEVAFDPIKHEKVNRAHHQIFKMGLSLYSVLGDV